MTGCLCGRVTMLMRSAASLGPHSGCFAPHFGPHFGPQLWPPLWPPLWRPNWLSMTGLRPSKTDFHSTKFAKTCVLYGRCRNNCKTNLVEHFGRIFMKIWFEIWQTIWRTIWSKIQTNLVECLKQDLVEHSSKFGRIFETSSRISFQLFSGQPRPAGLTHK